MIPDLNGESMSDVGWKIGLPPGLCTRHHNSAVAACPNGDLLAFYYNSFSEDAPNQSIVAVRLRYGSEDWGIPCPWPDFPDAADAAPIIWNDNGKLWLFWGCPRLGGYPFQWTTSTDNGATWSEIQFPLFESRIGHHTAQPINSAFRGPDGTIYIGFDGGTGGTSGLWATRNDGKTWFDTGGRTFGRHTTFVFRKDGSILGYGGKNTHIDLFMPISLSHDNGKTWERSKSPLPCLGGGQRPSMIRLASGRLFYVGDFAGRKKGQPEGFTETGAFAALSDDDGETWQLKKLLSGNTYDLEGNPLEVRTVGYVTACQSPNGLIHVVTSRGNPTLHIELNEAWILNEDNAEPSGEVGIEPDSVKEYGESYPSGKIKATWNAGTGEDGRYLLHGTETWYYENGQKQWEFTYLNGRKVGTETCWSRDGVEQRKWSSREDGTRVLTIRGIDGDVKAESIWRDDWLISYELDNPQS